MQPVLLYFALFSEFTIKTWETLNLASGSLSAGEISFTPPLDWTKTSVKNFNLLTLIISIFTASRYWLRLRCTTNPANTPVTVTSTEETIGQYEWLGVSGISSEK